MMHTRNNFSSSARGFTLIEMMVAVSILVIIILSIGVLFRGAGRSVGVSEASVGMLSEVRAVQQQIERDVAGIDKNAFLAIRCGTFTDREGITRRCDQIAFLSIGSFQHRTGADSATAQFADPVTSPSAFVWWGQLAMEGGASGLSTDQSKQLPLDQPPTAAAPYAQNPNQVQTEDSGFNLGRSTMILVPHDSSSNDVTPGGTTILAFVDNPTAPTYPLSAIDYYSSYSTSGHTAAFTNASEKAAADITQSRVDAAATTTAEIMACIRQGLAGGRNAASYGALAKSNSNLRFEADHYCYRRAALRSPYDGTSLINGYFRTTPIALEGVSSFAIDWTDGSVYQATEANASSASPAPDLVTGLQIGEQAAGKQDPALVGTTRWYGLCDNAPQNVYGYARGPTGAPVVLLDNAGTAPGSDFSSAGNKQKSPYVDNWLNSATLPNSSATSYGDMYTAVFGSDTPREKWPVALRFRFHVADPTGRLPRGRDFVQIVRLPQ